MILLWLFYLKKEKVEMASIYKTSKIISKMKNFYLITLSLLSIILFDCCDKSKNDVDNEINLNDGKILYAENYIDGMDALYNTEGYIALFGKRNIPIQFDSMGNISSNEERIIYIAQINENDNINNTDATVIVVDSTYFPTRIVGNGINAVITRIDNNHCNCLVYDYIVDEWKEFKNVEFLLNEIKNADEETPTRAMSTAGSNGFTLTTAINALSLLTNVGGAITNTGLAKLAPGIGIFGDVLSNIGLDEIGLGIAVTIGGLPGAVVGGIGYLSSKYDKLKKRFFCDDDKNIKISIENIQQIDRKTVEISYNVEGLNEHGLANSGLFFSLLYIDGMTKEVIILPVKNGYNKKILDDMESGTYEVDLNLISNEYPLCKYTTCPKVKFSIFNLELDRYEIEDNPLYENGAVNFKMNIYLEGDEESLRDIQQFGYYIKYANAIDYKQVKNFSSTFESTPLTYELVIPRDGFSDETTNYMTFEAKPSIDYYIGIYIVLKNGNIISFDEENIVGLVYCKKPELEFTSAQTQNTEVIETYDNGDIRYKTHYTFDYDINGCFWIDHIQYTISEKDVNNYWEPEYSKNDGNSSKNGWAEYTNSATHNSYYSIYLTNGELLKSKNGLELSCGGGSGSMSVMGGYTRNKSLDLRTKNIIPSINSQSK